MTNSDEDILNFFWEEFPFTISEGKINLNYLKAFFNKDKLLDDYYFLHWKGYEKVQSVIQTPPKSALHPNFTYSESNLIPKNIFFEGDSLEILKIIRRSYHQKVKIIIFNPPKRTQGDFIFTDSTIDIIENYQKQLKIPKTREKSTSEWLSFIYPRLFYSYSLLKYDGLFFAIASESEMHHIKILLDMLFTERNYMGTVIWVKDSVQKSYELSAGKVSYILIYAKNREYFVKNRSDFKLPDSIKSFSNPDHDFRGPWKADPFQAGGERKKSQYYPITNPNTGQVFYPNPGNCWKNSEEKFYELLEDNRIIFGKTGKGGPQRKRFWSEAKRRGRTPKTIWKDLVSNKQDYKDYETCNDSEPLPKPLPVTIYKRIIQLGTRKVDGIILDLFAGSGATAQAVIEINQTELRNLQYILIELPKKINVMSNVIGGSASKYAEIVQNHIDKYLVNPKLNGYRVFYQYPSKLAIPSQKNHDIEKIYELMWKEGLSPNLTIEIVGIPFDRYYKIHDGGVILIISFNKSITKCDILRLNLTQSHKFFCYDNALSDSVKLNITRLCDLQTITEDVE